ncbi:competence protein helix-hairpin-helix repeat protein : Competence protein ComEA helix-hairpin-helix repeat protein OS=Fervidobacterium nodosum (strain ATCC 35602 / DSM 5306 / Rt17-B1) GN=Fnod_1704 PE=4 SV=1: HHH_3: HHH_3 [Gemmata massiliana]|uniref:Helix-hairpin-helix DNA-binding motif class 1 domain-containing protein n=1 Tax=Gemmata massiliana TaxID=1210884 RepID=A0A6P2CXA3_9BACT|nr:helix-hairpin-helix domain-containing protein [Gemmata massiliana]VTR92364.1 competence protein helix-hairpin-helix repeat protein : Competence protein ComEA helix-hairpin-helix repeat protein OS=Fervidobacterium nodosum (strain ATCC 35602 / DSM 5306 / Rt17-B1) GN=Fnod_1704 PE=4 SV=1: HHH_3: HHH_3 [Gemmata massiliana]
MSAASLPPVANASGASAPSRSAQAALGVFLAVLLGLLVIRGYGNRFGARPTEPVAVDLTDLNTASQIELAQVPGVGPKMAEAIVDHRHLHGPYKSVEELRSVRGIGPITFEKVRSHFRTSTLTSAPLAEAPTSPTPATRATTPIAAPRPTSTSAKKIQPGEALINVNTAPQEELQRLPSIGPVIAQAIIAHRTQSPFQTVNDLDKVKGIGPKTLDKLRPFVVVN